MEREDEIRLVEKLVFIIDKSYIIYHSGHGVKGFHHMIEIIIKIKSL